MTQEFFQTHLSYTEWATLKLLDAADGLSSEEATKDLGSSFKSVWLTLQHVYYADRVWLNRLRGTPHPFADEGAGPDLVALRSAWPSLWAELRAYAAGLSAVDHPGSVAGADAFGESRNAASRAGDGHDSAVGTPAARHRHSLLLSGAS
jgi:DinB family